MPDYQCPYCKKTSGKKISMDGPNKGKVVPALSDRGCPKSPSGKHKWVRV